MMTKRLNLVGPLMASIVLMCSCEDDDPAPPSVDVTGTWRGSAGETLVLQQDSASLSGSSGGNTVSGSVEGNAVNLNVTIADGGSTRISATVDGNSMTGTKTDATGTTVSWSATRGGGTSDGTTGDNGGDDGGSTPGPPGGA